MPAVKQWLWLSAAGVSPRAKGALLRHYGSAEAAFYAPEGDFTAVEGLSKTEAEVLERRDLSRCEAIAGACARQGLSIVTMQDAAYPKRLKNIFAPPPVLYVLGRLPDVDANAPVAVIGTRGASPYGLKMGREIAYQIVRCGGLVVSGLTHGIDAAAARGALLAGGPVLGVLGVPHERESGPLARDVAAAGCLISEYPPGTQPKPHFFRERNRIAAGLSVGVVVVEAPEKSGTRLFALEALEQGKELFAVPGNADAENSAGAIALIKEGARLVTCGREVMAEFAPLYPDKVRLSGELPPPEQAPPAPPESRAKPGPKPEPEQKTVDKGQQGGYIDWKEQLAALTADQLKIVSAIGADAAHIDDIIEATGLPTATVLAQLTVLEIKGYVRREAGKRLALNIVRK